VNCKTIAEVEAAAVEESKDDPPLTQDQADYVAALLAPYRGQMAAASGETPADANSCEAA
jgi:hypothetical protein